ncbi:MULTISPECIES: metal-dependent hydrolase [Halostella]|uniref:metal-dependent hydrolase n=1 Tax=Halostella TaxID=1843185 RepID=UPI0010810959|nr:MULTISPECIES: metal-dependent hydrolase [Halostella]
MVAPLGHLGMALLFAVPAWLLWDGRVSLAFIGFTVATANLPDLDLYLPVPHHGVTHTIVFVTGVAVIVGAITEYALKERLDRLFLKERGYSASPGALFLFVAGGLFLGGMSHLFADTLSAPDIAKPLEPFWPFFDRPYFIDLVWYDSPWWNEGLLMLAVLVHLALAYVDLKVDHPYAISQQA